MSEIVIMKTGSDDLSIVLQDKRFKNYLGTLITKNSLLHSTHDSFMCIACGKCICSSKLAYEKRTTNHKPVHIYV